MQTRACTWQLRQPGLAGAAAAGHRAGLAIGSGEPRLGGRAHQNGFTDDADQDAAGQDWQVLQQEAGGHDQARGADEEGHEEVADAGQLRQAVLLLVGCRQHDPRHKGAQLRRQPLQPTTRRLRLMPVAL